MWLRLDQLKQVVAPSQLARNFTDKREGKGTGTTRHKYSHISRGGCIIGCYGAHEYETVDRALSERCSIAWSWGISRFVLARTHTEGL